MQWVWALTLFIPLKLVDHFLSYTIFKKILQQILLRYNSHSLKVTVQCTQFTVSPHTERQVRTVKDANVPLYVGYCNYTTIVPQGPVM